MSSFAVPVVRVRGVESIPNADAIELAVVGGGAHIREGVVVVPVAERRDDSIGRVILKSVSGDYLTRKGEATSCTPRSQGGTDG